MPRLNKLADIAKMKRLEEDQIHRVVMGMFALATGGINSGGCNKGSGGAGGGGAQGGGEDVTPMKRKGRRRKVINIDMHMLAGQNQLPQNL